MTGIVNAEILDSFERSLMQRSSDEDLMKDDEEAGDCSAQVEDEESPRRDMDPSDDGLFQMLNASMSAMNAGGSPKKRSRPSVKAKPGPSSPHQRNSLRPSVKTSQKPTPLPLATDSDEMPRPQPSGQSRERLSSGSHHSASRGGGGRSPRNSSSHKSHKRRSNSQPRGSTAGSSTRGEDGHRRRSSSLEKRRSKGSSSGSVTQREQSTQSSESTPAKEVEEEPGQAQQQDETTPMPTTHSERLVGIISSTVKVCAKEVKFAVTCPTEEITKVTAMVKDAADTTIRSTTAAISTVMGTTSKKENTATSTLTPEKGDDDEEEGPSEAFGVESQTSRNSNNRRGTTSRGNPRSPIRERPTKERPRSADAERISRTSLEGLNVDSSREEHHHHRSSRGGHRPHHSSRESATSSSAGNHRRGCNTRSPQRNRRPRSADADRRSLKDEAAGGSEAFSVASKEGLPIASGHSVTSRTSATTVSSSASSSRRGRTNRPPKRPSRERPSSADAERTHVGTIRRSQNTHRNNPLSASTHSESKSSSTGVRMTVRERRARAKQPQMAPAPTPRSPVRTGTTTPTSATTNKGFEEASTHSRDSTTKTSVVQMNGDSYKEQAAPGDQQQDKDGLESRTNRLDDILQFVKNKEEEKAAAVLQEQEKVTFTKEQTRNPFMRKIGDDVDAESSKGEQKRKNLLTAGAQVAKVAIGVAALGARETVSTIKNPKKEFEKIVKVGNKAAQKTKEAAANPKLMVQRMTSMTQQISMGIVREATEVTKGTLQLTRETVEGTVGAVKGIIRDDDEKSEDFSAGGAKDRVYNAQALESRQVNASLLDRVNNVVDQHQPQRQPWQAGPQRGLPEKMPSRMVADTAGKPISSWET